MTIILNCNFSPVYNNKDIQYFNHIKHFIIAEHPTRKLRVRVY